ncbi:MAG TPA: DUF4118 domain-containing protein [Acidimicrobiia bacterium]
MNDDEQTRRSAPSALSPLAWVVALAGPVVVSAVLVPLRSDIRTSNVSLVLVLVVVVAAVLGGRLGGAIAALVSFASFDFFFTRPYSSLTIDSRDDVETAVLLLVVGLAVGELVVRNRRSRTRAAQSRAEVVRVRRLSELAAGGEPAGRLIGIVKDELVALLHVDECRFEPLPFREDLPELRHQGVRIPAVDLPELAGDHRVALPVYGAGRPVGRFVIDLEDGATGIALPPEDRALAVALADQLGTVLGHESQP